MTFFQRLTGVFANPRPTFQAIAEKPAWTVALIVLILLAVVTTSLITPIAQKDQLQMMKDNANLKERLGEERFNQMVQSMENPSPVRRAIQTFVVGPLFLVIGLLFQSVILLVMGRFVSTQGSYNQVFGSLIYANFIDKLLGNAVRVALIFWRKSTFQVSTGLALFFPKLEFGSTPYMILANIDFFQLWTFGVLAYGLAAVFKVDLKKALFVSYGFWFLKTLVNIALGILGMSFLR
jgi:hypothetical protein